MAQRVLRIAAIDVGTNSIHMLVAEAKGREYRILDREKEMVQLGLNSLGGEPLTEEAIARGVAALSRMATKAGQWHADETVAVATSAVREAPNRREFLRRVREATGLEIRVISGEEEADFIVRAVRDTVDLAGRTALCIDIGGGSVEFVVGTAEETFLTRSLPLGSLRLAERFRLTGRADPAALAGCRLHVSDQLRRLQRKVHRLGIDLTVGTSGTINALVTICSQSADPAGGLRTLRKTRLAEMIPQLAAATAAERAERYGIDLRRATTILAGAITLDEILSAFGIEELVSSPAAMREGILMSRIAELGRAPRAGRSIRHRSVMSMARRTACDLDHASHVARLAGRIFDQTAGLHGCDAQVRQLLEYAALLHESGRHVSDRAHHKHTYYLIRHGDLKGFTDDEIMILANLARYYRKAEPDPEHPNFAELSPAQQETVRRMTGILRIAEALDRSHRQRVRDVGVTSREGRVDFVVRPRSDASLEIRSAAKRARFFGDVFGVKVRIRTP